MSFLGSCECHILELTSMAGQLSLDLALYLSNLYALPRLSLQKPAHTDSLANLRHLYFRAPRSSPSLYTECASPTVRPTSCRRGDRSALYDRSSTASGEALRMHGIAVYATSNIRLQMSRGTGSTCRRQMVITFGI
jgi:hypothetical protein